MTDPGIILFGKKIGLPETPSLPPCTTATENTQDSIAEKDQRKDKSVDDHEAPSIDEDGMSENMQTTDGDTMNLQSRTLKKPDKILSCPRCDSFNTKFCYFNNSNLNQPRHFCKSCQRYWTAGGTMRNMPVGAGRRKKKNPPSHCRYIISQEALESEPIVNHNLEFAPDSNGVNAKENRDECSSSSIVENNNGYLSHFHWIPGASWPYNPWNTPIPIQMPVYPPGYPQIPMCLSPYWNSVPWLPPTNSILGKHPMEVEGIKPNDTHDDELKKQKSSILIPKTLRIHDPDEAAKSSIWATLGIKNEHSGRGDLFQAFQSKDNEKKKNKDAEPSPVLQANPAALSRSLRFQERC